MVASDTVLSLFVVCIDLYFLADKLMPCNLMGPLITLLYSFANIGISGALLNAVRVILFHQPPFTMKQNIIMATPVVLGVSFLSIMPLLGVGYSRTPHGVYCFVDPTIDNTWTNALVIVAFTFLSGAFPLYLIVYTIIYCSLKETHSKYEWLVIRRGVYFCCTLMIGWSLFFTTYFIEFIQKNRYSVSTHEIIEMLLALALLLNPIALFLSDERFKKLILNSKDTLAFDSEETTDLEETIKLG